MLKDHTHVLSRYYVNSVGSFHGYRASARITRVSVVTFSGCPCGGNLKVHRSRDVGEHHCCYTIPHGSTFSANDHRGYWLPVLTKGVEFEWALRFAAIEIHCSVHMCIHVELPHHRSRDLSVDPCTCNKSSIVCSQARNVTTISSLYKVLTQLEVARRD